MRSQLTPGISLDNLKKDAKRWLKALRSGDDGARGRLAAAWPDAPATPTLRDVQHALARELGVAGWSALKTALAALQPERDDATRVAAINALLDASGRGDAAAVTQLLDSHTDIINERAGEGTRTALHRAVFGAREEMVALLLKRGADPDIRCDGDSATPLHFAAEKEHLGIIRLLVEHGADPVGDGDYHELGVLGWATCFGSARREVADYLLAHGARHTMFSAVATGAVDAIRALAAQSPADLERRMDSANRRRFPLHLAVVKQQPVSLATLLELGANTESLDQGGLTTLDQAALHGEAALAQLLLDHGAKLRLPAAVALERHEDVERLVRREPDCLKPGKRYGNLIVRAAERSTGRVIDQLVALGASVSVHDDTRTAVDSSVGYTALHAAAFFGNADGAVALVRHGASVTAREHKYCGTPAGWANYAGHHAVRDLILEGPIDLFDALAFDRYERIPGIVTREPAGINRVYRELLPGKPESEQWWPDSWCTPLAVAVRTGKIDAARMLLELGADATLRDPGGRTLEEHAERAGEIEMVRLLRDYAGRSPQ